MHVLTPHERKERQWLIDRQRRRWSDGSLARSVWNDALDALGLAGHPDSVSRPYRLAEFADEGQRLLPLDARVVERFDAHQGRLLIVGPPGCGKTTLLRELQRDLLDRAEADEAQPVPVVFDLATFGTRLEGLFRERNLTHWMVEQLQRYEDVTAPTAEDWIERGVIATPQ